MDQSSPPNTVARHLFPTRALAATRPAENSSTVAILIDAFSCRNDIWNCVHELRATPSIVVTKQGPANNTP